MVIYTHNFYYYSCHYVIIIRLLLLLLLLGYFNGHKMELSVSFHDVYNIELRVVNIGNICFYY